MIQSKIKLSMMLALWILYFVGLTLYGNLYLKNNWGMLCEILQLANLVVLIIGSSYLFLNMNKFDKSIFLWFIFYHISLFISAISYFTVVYLFNLKDINQEYSLIYIIPSMLWISCATFYWGRLCYYNFKLKDNLLVIFTVALINVCLIYLVSRLELNPLNYQAKHVIFFQNYTNIGSFFILNFAILSLICLRSIGMKLLAAGTISIFGANFLTSYIAYSYKPSSIIYKNDFWFFSSTILIAGVVCLVYQKDHNQIKSFSQGRSIKSILTASTLITVIFTAVLCITLAEMFHILGTEILSLLPYFIVMCIIFAALASVLLSQVFESSINQLNLAIRNFVENKSGSKNISIAELDALNEFVQYAINLISEKNKIKENMYKYATRVVHDLHSPVTSLMTMATTYSDIPEDRRITLRNVAFRINEIASGLLYKYRQSDDVLHFDLEDPVPIFVALTIEQLIVEKNLEYASASIKFITNFTHADKYLFIKVKPANFKRMISNLINNAVQAIGDKIHGVVEIRLLHNHNKVTIEVSDNGCGMSLEMIEKILHKESIIKESSGGHGIGLAQIWQAIDNDKGSMVITSQINEGTTFAISFTQVSTPNAVTKTIIIHSEDIIVVLDDDCSIHDALDMKFEALLSTNSRVQIHHFTRGNQAIEFINTLSDLEKERLFLLTDYELIEQGLNGLDVILQTQTRRSILITSHYDNNEINQRIVYMGCKILPKQLVPEVAIEFNDKELYQHKRKNKMVLVAQKFLSAQNFMNDNLRRIKVDIFDTASQLIDNTPNYIKSSPIIIFDDFNQEGYSRFELAEKLSKLGFSKVHVVVKNSWHNQLANHAFNTIDQAQVVELAKNLATLI